MECSIVYLVRQGSKCRKLVLAAYRFSNYIGCIKEGSRKNYATYEIKEYAFAIFEFQCKMFIAKHIDQKVANKLIEKALEYGINFIDTARGYTESESLIGNALTGNRQKVFLATKSMEREKNAIKKDIEISLNNFKTDYIDLYQFHNIATFQDLEKVMAPGGALEAFME